MKVYGGVQMSYRINLLSSYENCIFYIQFFHELQVECYIFRLRSVTLLVDLFP